MVDNGHGHMDILAYGCMSVWGWVGRDINHMHGCIGSGMDIGCHKLMHKRGCNMLGQHGSKLH